MSLLKISRLSIRFPPKNKLIIRDVSLSIDRCQTLGLVGQSGSGKSSVALSILQLHRNVTQSGSIRFEDKELVNAPECLMRTIRGNRISIVFQDSLAALNPLHTIEKQISEVIKIHNKISNIKERVLELMDIVELANLKNRLNAFPHQLSGGQRQRVMLAIALANNPDLLIADEPTSALDVVTQMQILKLLQKLKNKISILFISHNLNIVRKVADKVSVIHKGKICETADTAKIYQSPQHDYTKKLLGATLSTAPAPEAEVDQNAVIVQNLSVELSASIIFKKYHKVIDDMSFCLKQGCTLGIAGVSGSGKSTLAQAMLKLIKSKGKIYINNHPIHNDEYPIRKYRQDMQIIFQDPFSSLNPRMKIDEIISEGINLHRKSSGQEKAKLIRKTLKDVSLKDDILSKYPHECSGGERQRVAIARVLTLSPKFIVLDEPTSALDYITQCQIIKLLIKIQQKYKITYLFISHDLQIIKSLSHYIIILEQGKIVETGPTQQILSSPKNKYTKRLIEASFEL
ncbi:ABC transporter ATP-binding protein [Rickettsiales bacterium]|nr:ABC transporter ATP-binding protein [Rickettsiales bacterium]